MDKFLLALMALIISGCGNKEQRLSPFDPTNTPIKSTLKCSFVDPPNLAADGRLYLGIYEDSEGIIDHFLIIDEKEGFYFYNRYRAEYKDFSISYEAMRLKRDTLEIYNDGYKTYECNLTETTLASLYERLEQRKIEFKNEKLEANQI